MKPGDLVHDPMHHHAMWRSPSMQETVVVDNLNPGERCIILLLEEHVIEDDRYVMAKVLSPRGIIGWLEVEYLEVIP